MNVINTELTGLVVIESRIHRDPRGHFLECWHRSRYQDAGLPYEFVQDNVSHSMRDVLRGLHFQHPNAQAKLVVVLRGEIYDVAVDLRSTSATFGRWFGLSLSAESGRQMFIPEGFAHGFAVTSDEALVLYKCTRHYDPQAERSILWSDPDLRIDWPVKTPILSDKDASAPRLREALMGMGCNNTGIQYSQSEVEARL
jgi:dTDP-4-dehydrorhamnose 3,5-epimerase